jgi:hypothetical protein
MISDYKRLATGGGLLLIISCPPPVFSLKNRKIPEKLSTQRDEFPNL